MQAVYHRIAYEAITDMEDSSESDGPFSIVDSNPEKIADSREICIWIVYDQG